MKTLRVWLSLVSFAIPSIPALGAPGGELDATFGENGRLVMSQLRLSGAVVQQPADGKLVIAGATAWGADREVVAVLRLNPDGSLDDSFGDQGIVALAVGDGTSSATALALQADGRIVVAGQADPATGSTDDLVVARLNSDGTLDPSFDGDGLVTAAGAGSPSHVAVAPDGGISLAAWYENFIALVRLTSTGAPDVAFGVEPTPGIEHVEIGDLIESSRWLGVTVARQADGAYIVCGADVSDLSDDYYYWYWETTKDMKAIRLLADGSLDTGFGSGGVWQLERDDNIDSAASACLVTADGNILIAGSRESHPLVVKVRPDGVTDTSVWTSGAIELASFGGVSSLVELEDGDLALTGTLSSSINRRFIARIDSVTGLPDPDFGEQGTAFVDFGHGSLQSSFGEPFLIEQSDGKLVTVATVGYWGVVVDSWFEDSRALALARIDPNGPGNNGFVGFDSAFHSVGEGFGNEATVTIYRSGGSSGPFLVEFETIAETASESDFQATSGTLVWSDGETAPKTISVRVAADNVAELTESFRVALSSPTGALAQNLTTVAIYDEPGLQIVPDYSKGGGGAFGFELTVLLLGALILSRCRTRIPFGGDRAHGRRQRLRAARLAQLIAFPGLITAGGAAQSETVAREDSWDVGVVLVDSGDASVAGPAGSSIRMMSDQGLGFWANYNLTSRVAIGVEWSRLSPEVETTWVEDHGPAVELGPMRSIRHTADIENIHLQGTLNFLDRNVTPFAEVGIGWTKLDSNVDVADAAVLDLRWAAWYDPWWGYVWNADVVPGTYEGTNTSVTYALGVRWDISTRVTVRAAYSGIEGHQVSAVSGSAEPKSYRLGFGWRF